MVAPAFAHAPERCVVCGAALARAAVAPDDPFPACFAVACRMVVSRRAGMGDANFRHYLQQHAAQLRQRLEAVRAGQAHRDAETAENAAAWAALQARLAPGSPAPLRLLLPSGPRRQARVAAARRARYRAHLETVAAQAELLAPGVVTADEHCAPVSTLPGRLCGMCGGGCCTLGGDYAYVDAPVLRRCLDAHPEWTAGAVVDFYLAHVAPKTQAGSCINHTRAGCALPRELRSDTCNRYACEALVRLQMAQGDGVAGMPLQAVLVVRRKHDHWRRAEAGPANAIAGATVLAEG